MQVTVEGRTFEGSQIKTPHVSLLVLTGPNALLGCGYINAAVGEAFGDPVAIVRGVKSFEEMLKAKVVEVNPTATALGAVVGMTGREYLLKLHPAE